MAQQTDLAIRIAAIFDAAGMNKADKSISKLEKNAKKLGKSLGIALSVAAVTAFGKAAVKAFTDDQKSAAMLTLAVKNLGLAFEQANIDKFISDLEGSAGMADDVLRPAFQALLTTTGSVIKSQELLKTAIEASRGSGIDLATVAQDLANAYVGNTKGLKKYNLGLTQAELKAMSFLEIQQRMNDQFKGASAAYLATYTGQMEALSVAAGNAAEVIGQSLVEAILNVSGATDASTLGTYIENVAGYLAGLIDSVAKFVFSVKWLTNPKNWLKGGDEMWAEWDRIVQKRQMAAARLFDPKNNAVTGYKVDEAARNKAVKDAARRQKELLAAQNKQTAELKKQAALKKAGTVFDMEQIQIVAALKGKLSEEDKIRLQAQLALLNGNADLATKLTNQILAAQDSSGNLAKFLAALPNARNPFEYLDGYLSYLAGKAAALVTNKPVPSAPSEGNNTTPAVPSTNVPTMPSDGMISYNTLTGLNYNPNANISLEVKFTGGDDVSKAIANNLQQQSLSTGNVTYINRRTGGFE
jgi:hypothetical protein